MASMFLERYDIIEGAPAVDLNTAGLTGDWVTLKNATRVAIVFRSGVGTAGDDPTLTINQATDVAGTGSKALNIVTTQAYKKQAATDQSAVVGWTAGGADISTNTFTNTDAAEQSVTWVVEFRPDQLDVDGGFDCIQATIADPGAAAQPGDLLYILELKEMRAPANAVDSITD